MFRYRIPAETDDSMYVVGHYNKSIQFDVRDILGKVTPCIGHYAPELVQPGCRGGSQTRPFLFPKQLFSSLCAHCHKIIPRLAVIVPF